MYPNTVTGVLPGVLVTRFRKSLDRQVALCRAVDLGLLELYELLFCIAVSFYMEGEKDLNTDNAIAS